MDQKKNYEAPRVISREDLKEITLYTGSSPRQGSKRPRDPQWKMP